MLEGGMVWSLSLGVNGGSCCKAMGAGCVLADQPKVGAERVSLWCLGTLQPMGGLGQGLSSGRERSRALQSWETWAKTPLGSCCSLFMPPPICLPFSSGLPHHTLMTVLITAANEGPWL